MTKSRSKAKHTDDTDRPLSAKDYRQRQQERQERMRELWYRCLAGEIAIEELLLGGKK